MAPTFFLVLSLCLTSATLSVVLAIAWRSFDREAHARTWSIAFAVATAQWAVNLSSASFTDPRLYWVLVNGLAIVTVTLALIGHRQRTGRRPLVGPLAAAGLVVGLLLFWFTWVEPHVGLRMALQPAYAGVLLLWVAVLLVRFRPRPVLAEVAAGVVHGAFAVLELTAALVALAQGAERQQYLFDWYLKINFLAMPAAYVGMGLFVVLILASDLAERARQLAATDPLTGLLNRRGLNEAATRLLAQARRGRQDVALVLADLDQFKEINDAGGHVAGDRALVLFAEQLRRDRRADDLVARLGGDEFAMLLPNTDAKRAAELAERLRERLSRVALEPRGSSLRLTASFGVAGGESPRDLELLTQAADRALYRAKQAGRDRVESEAERDAAANGKL